MQIFSMCGLLIFVIFIAFKVSLNLRIRHLYVVMPLDFRLIYWYNFSALWYLCTTFHLCSRYTQTDFEHIVSICVHHVVIHLFHFQLRFLHHCSTIPCVLPLHILNVLFITISVHTVLSFILIPLHFLWWYASH